MLATLLHANSHWVCSTSILAVLSAPLSWHTLLSLVLRLESGFAGHSVASSHSRTSTGPCLGLAETKIFGNFSPNKTKSLLMLTTRVMSALHVVGDHPVWRWITSARFFLKHLERACGHTFTPSFPLLCAPLRRCSTQNVIPALRLDSACGPSAPKRSLHQTSRLCCNSESPPPTGRVRWGTISSGLGFLMKQLAIPTCKF
mmetsp:Transcript_70737/g.207174  ORF Transcript_70737/g.207174 Transcript_70737/m.207174 type:complete len:201 (-) Transcript_70737:434-1036(-)